MSKTASAFAVLAASLVLAAPLGAQSQEKDAGSTVHETIAKEQGTQESRDEWAQEQSELILRLRTARANVQYLTESVAFETSKAEALSENIAELERRLEEASRLQSCLQDTLNAVLGRLEDWVAADLPFLPEEREARLENLHAEIVNPETIGAEKLRRLLEALAIETNYGNTVEVTQSEIDLAGEKLFVDVLRLGRVSLFWRTTDGRRVGEFDRGSGRWVELPGKYRRSVTEAMEMATRVRPVEVISLPLGRIEP